MTINFHTEKVKVMVVDDSATIRGLFINLLESDPEIEVVASAGNAEIALNILKRQGDNKIEVDVITLDIEMPILDGLSALPQMLKIAPKAKIIMASSSSGKGARETVYALQAGAADYIQKPINQAGGEGMHDFARELLMKVRTLGGLSAQTKPIVRSSIPQNSKGGEISVSAPTALSTLKSSVIPSSNDVAVTLRKGDRILRPEAIAIGCSTGGPQALSTLFKALRSKTFNVPVFITQHMPAQFTSTLAKQLKEASGMEVMEAEEGQKVEAGKIYLAKGDFHLTLKRKGLENFIVLDKGEKENYCRPAVDPMLRSLVSIYGSKLLVLIMTGMGTDGQKGCQQVVNAGGTVFAQDKATSIVWGMPGAVATAGLCHRLVPLNDIAAHLVELAQGQIA